MRILHVIPGLAISSGPTQVVLRLSEEQAKRGDEVAVFCLRGRLEAKEMNPAGIVRVETFDVIGPKFWGYSPGLKARVTECAEDFDLVHVHSLWCYQNIVVHLVARKFGVPYIVRPAGSLEPWALSVSRIRKWLYFQMFEKGVLRDATALHAMSDKEARTLKRLELPSRVFTIPNGIDLAKYSQAKSREEILEDLNLPGNVPIILYLGRIHPVKGLDIVGDVMVKVRAVVSEAILVVAGPDQHSYAEEIKELYAELGLGDSVRFLGEVSESIGAMLYAAADVFLLPSESENFANVVLESMAAGTPPIVSEGVPWPELNTWGAGRWVKRDAGVLANSVIELLSDSERLKSCSARAREVAKQHFGWDSVVTRMRREYTAILASHCNG